MNVVTHPTHDKEGSTKVSTTTAEPTFAGGLRRRCSRLFGPGLRRYGQSYGCVQLLTPTHPIEPRPRRDKLEAAQPITLGDNVWLGCDVIVCSGVTIGENSVIGAGSVVTGNIPAVVVAVGSPAPVMRDI